MDTLLYHHQQSAQYMMLSRSCIEYGYVAVIVNGMITA